jgi:hypothetical protein
MPQTVPVDPDRRNRAERRADASDDRRSKKRALRPRFCSVQQAADYIGVSRAYFYAKYLVQVRTIQIGRRRLVEVDSLDELGDELLAAG